MQVLCREAINYQNHKQPLKVICSLCRPYRYKKQVKVSARSYNHILNLKFSVELYFFYLKEMKYCVQLTCNFRKVALIQTLHSPNLRDLIYCKIN